MTVLSKFYWRLIDRLVLAFMKFSTSIIIVFDKAWCSQFLIRVRWEIARDRLSEEIDSEGRWRRDRLEAFADWLQWKLNEQ